MISLTCIAQDGNCKGPLVPVGRGEGKSYTVRYFSCEKCHTRHYLPTFEGVDLALEDYQDSLLLKDPMDGKIDRG
jgi:hypothetical protein